MTVGVVLRVTPPSGRRGNSEHNTALTGTFEKLATAVRARRKSARRLSSAAAVASETDNLRITDVRPLLPPACLLEELPRSSDGALVVREARAAIAKILNGESDRLVVLAGPAAVDSPAAALEYAARLATLARQVRDEVVVVMRCEFATPVTPSTGPWPGLLFDPERDGSYQINSGIRKARSLLLQVRRSCCHATATANLPATILRLPCRSDRGDEAGPSICPGSVGAREIPESRSPRRPPWPTRLVCTRSSPGSAFRLGSNSATRSRPSSSRTSSRTPRSPREARRCRTWSRASPCR